MNFAYRTVAARTGWCCVLLAPGFRRCEIFGSVHLDQNVRGKRKASQPILHYDLPCFSMSYYENKCVTAARLLAQLNGDIKKRHVMRVLCHTAVTEFAILQEALRQWYATISDAVVAGLLASWR